MWHFELDIVTALINASNPDAPKPVNTGGQILTALVLAGGSAGVNSILVALGFRQVTTQQTQPRPRPDKAWISVRAVRKSGTTSSIDVLIGPEITLASGGKEPPFVGTITGTSGMGVVSFFALDRGRYPNYGGHEVDSNQEIFIVLRDSEKKTDLATWGPHKLAQGAIVDLDLSA